MILVKRHRTLSNLWSEIDREVSYTTMSHKEVLHIALFTIESIHQDSSCIYTLILATEWSAQDLAHRIKNSTMPSLPLPMNLHGRFYPLGDALDGRHSVGLCDPGWDKESNIWVS